MLVTSIYVLSVQKPAVESAEENGVAVLVVASL